MDHDRTEGQERGMEAGGCHENPPDWAKLCVALSQGFSKKAKKGG